MRTLKRIAWITVFVVGFAIIVHAALHAWSTSTLAGASWAQGTCPTCHYDKK